MKKFAISTALLAVLSTGLFGQTESPNESPELKSFLISGVLGLNASVLQTTRAGIHWNMALQFKRIKMRFEVNTSPSIYDDYSEVRAEQLVVFSADAGYTFLVGDEVSITPLLGWSRVKLRENQPVAGLEPFPFSNTDGVSLGVAWDVKTQSLIGMTVSARVVPQARFYCLSVGLRIGKTR